MTDAIHDQDVAEQPLPELPLLLTPAQLSALLGRSERTLERERCDGVGIPFVKYGKRVYYFRDVVMASLRERTYTSTAEAKRAAKGDRR